MATRTFFGFKAARYLPKNSLRSGLSPLCRHKPRASTCVKRKNVWDVPKIALTMPASSRLAQRAERSS
jgi:hypothetical protein